MSALNTMTQATSSAASNGERSNDISKTVPVCVPPVQTPAVSSGSIKVMNNADQRPTYSFLRLDEK